MVWEVRYEQNQNKILLRLRTQTGIWKVHKTIIILNKKKGRSKRPKMTIIYHRVHYSANINWISQHICAIFENLTNFLTTKKPENYKPIVSSFAILCLLNSSDEWTYRSKVIPGVECPNTSLSDFISKPTSTHLVAKVCRNTWKCIFSIPQAALYFFM